MPDVTVQDLIRQEAQKAGIPASLALAVAEQESGFNPTVLGPKLPSGEQAIGTFQILPSTAKARGFDPSDPVQNIRGGVGYLRELLDQHQGDLEGVLKDYGGVKNDTAYVPSVLDRATKFAGTTPSEQPTQPPVRPQWFQGPVAPPQTRAEFMARKAKELGVEPYTIPLGDVATGFAQSLGRGAVQAGRLLHQIPGVDRVFGSIPPNAEETLGLTSKTTGQKIGAVAEQIAEFGAGTTAAKGAATALNVAGRLASRMTAANAIRTAAAAEGILQGATSAGITKVQGGTNTETGINAALGAVGPVAAAALELRAPAIRAAAEAKLAKVFSKGLVNAGPMVTDALATGQVAPQVQDAVRIVKQAASDTIDLPIQGAWGRWMTGLGFKAAAKGKSIEDALKAGLGDQDILPAKAAIIDSLRDLMDTSAKHWATMNLGSGPSRMQVAHNKELANSVQSLIDELDKYHVLTVQNLVDLKRTWDSKVYTLATEGKVGLSKEALEGTAIKEAYSRGADAIRKVFDQEVPTVAALDAAASHAYRLQDLVMKLYAKQPGVGPKGHYAATVAGAGGGLALGGVTGHPYIGMGIGSGAGRLLTHVVETPLFQTLTPMMKGKLATALARGDSDTVRRLLAPILAAQVSSSTGSGQFIVTAPNGRAYQFDSQSKADAFRRGAGVQ